MGGTRSKDLIRLVVIASKQLPLLEAIITFQKLRKFNFGKVIIASSRGKTILTRDIFCL